MPRKSCRSCQASGKAQKKKRYNEQPDRQEHILLARIESDKAKLAALRAAKSPATAQATRTAQHEPEEEPIAKDYGDQRVVIKFFYEQFGSPPEEQWKHRYGTISRIRSMMGDCAPKPDTVERTLKRIRDGDEDISSKPHAGGSASLLSSDEDILVGLLACRGFSQPMALQFLNLQRLEADPENYHPVSLCSGRAKRPFVPHPDCQAALDALKDELGAAVKCARK